MHAFDVIANPLVKAALTVRGSKKLFSSVEKSQQALLTSDIKDGKDYEPPDFHIKSAVIRTDDTGCPVFTVVPYTPCGTRIIYFHGGAYTRDINPLHFVLADRLARENNATVQLMIYPKAPRHTHEDTFICAQTLYARAVREAGCGNVYLAGDSCGGAIAATLCHRLHEMNAPMPAGLILYSPLCDLRLNNALIDEMKRDDPTLGTDGLKKHIEAWIGDTDIESPNVNPAFINPECFPRTTIFTGTNEILSPDAISLAYKIQQNGGKCDLHVYTNMYHDFVLYPLKAAEKTRRRTTEFINAK